MNVYSVRFYTKTGIYCQIVNATNESQAVIKARKLVYPFGRILSYCVDLGNIG